MSGITSAAQNAKQPARHFLGEHSRPFPATAQIKTQSGRQPISGLSLRMRPAAIKPIQNPIYADQPAEIKVRQKENNTMSSKQAKRRRKRQQLNTQQETPKPVKQSKADFVGKFSQ